MSIRNSILVRVVCLGLLATAALAAEPKPVPEAAVVRVSGQLICAHCELGVGSDCCTGLRSGESVFVLEGPANKTLFEKRQSGGPARVAGTVRVQDGLLYLQSTVEPATSPVPPTVSVTGRVTAADAGVMLANGKSPIRVLGDPAKSLPEQAGRRVEIQGKLAVDRQGQVRLQAASIKPAAEPAKETDR